MLPDNAIKPLFMVGIPTYGEHSFLFTQSLSGVAMPTNFSMQMRFVQGWEVGRARNMLINEAQRIGAKYIMFLDEDVIFPGNMIQKLVYHLQNHPEWTFIAGLYATKTIPPEPMLYTEWAQGVNWDWKQGELVKVLFTGMGCSIIRVSDFDLLEAEEYHDKNPWYAADVVVKEYFKTQNMTGSTDKIGWTEDAYFFKKLADAGLNAYVDTGMLCQHYDKNTKTLFSVPNDNGTFTKPDPWNRDIRVCNLGAGGEYDPYEVSVDLRDDPHITYKCDIRNLPSDWTDKFQLVKSNHVLEHISHVQTLDVLKEWARIVEPGGVLRVTVPDFEFACRMVLEGRTDLAIMGIIYGDQGHPYWLQDPYGEITEDGRLLKHSFENNSHKYGFTEKTLKKLFEEAGLEEVSSMHSDRAEIIVAGRKPIPEQETEDDTDRQ